VANCDSCGKPKPNIVSAVVAGKYYRNVCQSCLGGTDIGSGAASYARRRDYEDNAQDTIQPYDAVGANPEFARLYPDTAKKIYKPEVLEQLKRKM
jgi:hypothetical protein